MKIWILMQEIQTLGGVQRVVTTLFNRISDNGKYDIYIFAPESNNNIQLYPVNKNIKCINSKRLRKKKNFWEDLLKKINSHFALFEKMRLTYLCDKLYFPEKEVNGFCKTISSIGIDCIIGAGAYYSIMAAKIANVLNVKCIAWMHSTYDAYFNAPTHEAYGLLNVFTKYVTHMEKVLVLTNEDKKNFENNIPFLNGRVVVQYNPITIQIQNESVLDKRKVLFVGRLNIETKGIDRLIPIMKSINSKLPDVLLEVVGDGGDKDKLFRLIAENHMENNIVLEGSSRNVEMYYQHASVLLVTSRYEGFGLVITEAMAYGIPVVAFHANGPDEIISDGIDGYLIDQGNTELFAYKVIELLSNEDLLNRMSRNAKRKAQDFETDKILEHFLNTLG